MSDSESGNDYESNHSNDSDYDSEVSWSIDEDYMLNEEQKIYKYEYGRHGIELMNMDIEKWKCEEEFYWLDVRDADDDDLEKYCSELYRKSEKLESDTKKINAINTIDKKTEKKLDKFLILDILKMANL